MAENKFLPKLSQNLLEISDDENYYDISIEVGNDPYVKVFHAHMVILNYRSPYLRRVLSTNEKKNDGTLSHIKLPNILPEIFQMILRYIYCGKLSLKECDTLDIIKILIAASELSLHELIPHLQFFLIENKVDWMIQNFSLIYQTSFENESFLELRKFCIKLISKEPKKIFNSPDFTSISEKSLISIIQNDNVQMSIVQIWEYVLKWGIAQNPELSSDPSNFSKDDFNILRNTLKQCIPFIKFFKLTSKEFLNKVYPYKKVIPKEMYENLIKYFLDHDCNHNSKPQLEIIKEIDHENIDSKIITIQHVELISKWIDRLEITDKIKNLYEFKLILRGSRDGFMPKKFHEICDYQSRTVTIIKVKNSDEILGGYNPIEWKSSGYGITKDSFIFSFTNKENINDHIISRVKDEKNAMNYWNRYGPSFGFGDLIMYGSPGNDYDFYNNNNNNYCRKRSYEKLIRETDGTFSIEEYEVFQIM